MCISWTINCLILVMHGTTMKFLVRFSKNPQISNFTKTRPLGAQLFHADRRKSAKTDMTNLAVAFRNFANASKNLYVLPTQRIYSFCVVLRSVIISLHNINMFR